MIADFAVHTGIPFRLTARRTAYCPGLRDVLQNGAGVSIAGHHITVHLKKKVHLPALFELPWMRTPTPLSWMDASIAFDTATTS